VAFHLHRLKLVGRTLHAAGYHNADAADIAAARNLLTQRDIDALAERLGVTRPDLTRQLTPDEQRQWAFYRASAANPREVWSAARAAWTSRGLSERDAAKVMGLKPTTIINTKYRVFALSFAAALRLTTALNVPGGPEALLPLPKRDTNEQTR
jgi:hypothetical protein